VTDLRPTTVPLRPLLGGWSSGSAAGRAKRHDTSANDQEDPDGEQHTLLPAKACVPDPERIRQRADQRGHNAHEDDHHSSLLSRHRGGKAISPETGPCLKLMNSGDRHQSQPVVRKPPNIRPTPDRMPAADRNGNSLPLRAVPDRGRLNAEARHTTGLRTFRGLTDGGALVETQVCRGSERLLDDTPKTPRAEPTVRGVSMV